MGKTVTVRKSGSSLVMTVPADIAEMFNITEGSQLEIEPFTSNPIQLKVKVRSEEKIV